LRRDFEWAGGVVANEARHAISLIEIA
jgi:hypothetical protein